MHKLQLLSKYRGWQAFGGQFHIGVLDVEPAKKRQFRNGICRQLYSSLIYPHCGGIICDWLAVSKSSQRQIIIVEVVQQMLFRCLCRIGAAMCVITPASFDRLNTCPSPTPFFHTHVINPATITHHYVLGQHGKRCRYPAAEQPTTRCTT